MTFRISDTVKHLLIINVLFFIGTISMGKMTSFVDLFAMHFPQNTSFKPWQIITHMFMHGSTSHIFFNMLLLWMFGSPLEYTYGKKRFIFLYFTAGLGAIFLALLVDYFKYFNLISDLKAIGLTSEVIKEIVSVNAIQGDLIKGELLMQQIEPVLVENNVSLSLINRDIFNNMFELNVLGAKVMMGASGAIMGLLAAFAVNYPDRYVYLLIPPIPIKVKYLVVGLIGSDVISAFLTGTPLLANSNIGYTAHVGGAIAGFLVAWYWKRTQFNKNRWN